MTLEERVEVLERDVREIQVRRDKEVPIKVVSSLSQAWGRIYFCPICGEQLNFFNHRGEERVAMQNYCPSCGQKLRKD